jgi:hypothetical protein
MEDSRRVVVRSVESLKRGRLAVLFRTLLLVPHSVVLSVWAVWVALVLPVSWLVALLAGRVPSRLHGWLAAFFRYQGQVTAWFGLLSAHYPDPQRTRQHPFAIDTPEPGRQRRLVTLLRVPLAMPALVLSSVFSVLSTGVSVGAWLVALPLGRTTAGLQELGSFCLRYQLETQAYVLLLTSAYPRLTPPPPARG